MKKDSLRKKKVSFSSKPIIKIIEKESESTERSFELTGEFLGLKSIQENIKKVKVDNVGCDDHLESYTNFESSSTDIKSNVDSSNTNLESYNAGAEPNTNLESNTNFNTEFNTNFNTELNTNINGHTNSNTNVVNDSDYNSKTHINDGLKNNYNTNTNNINNVNNNSVNNYGINKNTEYNKELKNTEENKELKNNNNTEYNKELKNKNEELKNTEEKNPIDFIFNSADDIEKMLDQNGDINSDFLFNSQNDGFDCKIKNNVQIENNVQFQNNIKIENIENNIKIENGDNIVKIENAENNINENNIKTEKSNENNRAEFKKTKQINNKGSDCDLKNNITFNKESFERDFNFKENVNNKLKDNSFFESQPENIKLYENNNLLLGNNNLKRENNNLPKVKNSLKPENNKMYENNNLKPENIKMYENNNLLLGKNKIFEKNNNNLSIVNNNSNENNNKNESNISNIKSGDENVCDTKNLRKILNKELLSFEEIQSKYKIRFHDKIHYIPTKRETLVTEEIQNNQLYFYKYHLKEELNHFTNLITNMEEEFERCEKKIQFYENERFSPDTNFIALKTYCRNKAKIKWYKFRTKIEEEKNKRRMYIKNELKNQLKMDDFSFKLEKLREENENLRVKIKNEEKLADQIRNENIEEKIKIINNYFTIQAKNENIEEKIINNYSTIQMSDLNLTYETLKDENNIFVEVLEEHRQKKMRRQEKMQKRKVDLERQLYEIEGEISKYEVTNKYRNVTEEECENQRKIIRLYHSINNFKIVRLFVDDVVLEFRNLRIIKNLRIVNENNVEKNLRNVEKDGYFLEIIDNFNFYFEWAIKYIKKGNVREIIREFNRYFYLFKEIENFEIGFLEDKLEICSGNKVLIFDLEYIRVTEDGNLFYEGKRRDGMIKEILKTSF